MEGNMEGVDKDTKRHVGDLRRLCLMEMSVGDYGYYYPLSVVQLISPTCQRVGSTQAINDYLFSTQYLCF